MFTDVPMHLLGCKFGKAVAEASLLFLDFKLPSDLSHAWQKNNNTGLTYFVPSTEGLDAKPSLPARPKDRDLSHAWPKKTQKNPNRSDILCVLSGRTRC